MCDPVGVERMSGIDDIAAERRRQVEEEGWSAEHDDTHDAGQLARAAACYAYEAGWPAARVSARGPDHLWPWHPDWWKPSDRRRNLVKAGALIAAEIDRLDRAAAQTKET